MERQLLTTLPWLCHHTAAAKREMLLLSSAYHTHVATRRGVENKINELKSRTRVRSITRYSHTVAAGALRRKIACLCLCDVKYDWRAKSCTMAHSRAALCEWGMRRGRQCQHSYDTWQLYCTFFIYWHATRIYILHDCIELTITD